MYGWIWRHLPGPFAVRIITAVLLVLGVLALLMFVVFPYSVRLYRQALR